MLEIVPEQVQAALEEVFAYASYATEWIVVKKELLKCLPSGLRTLFSLRDPITKKQRINNFELTLIKHWHDLGGNELLFIE